MLLNYILLAFRTFFKNKTAFLINLLGLSIALGCCITAWVNYQYNIEFDKQQSNATRLYRIGFWQQTERGRVPFGVCPMPAANLIRETLREEDQVIQYISKDSQFRIGDELFEEEFVYVDPSFTKIFTLELLHGSLDLSDKGRVVISDELAKRYFGKSDAVGMPLTQLISGEPREFVVGGVYKRFPANSSFRFELISTYDNYFTDPSKREEFENDWARWATTFVYLNNAASIAGIEKQLSAYITTQNDARPDLKIESFNIEPFKGMAARAARERVQGHWMNMSMPPAAVIAPFAMAGFLLLVACFNFMNNAIAVSGNRLKEIGIRKVIGGNRKQLIFQFLAETMVFCLVSLALALVLAEYFTDGWNGMWSGIEMEVRYNDNLPFFVMLTALMAFTALLAGGYPAFYISAFRPIQILRGTTRFGGANWLTKSLLVFQFSISLAAVIFALAFYFNSKFQKSYDLGYSWRSIVQVPLDDASKFDLLKNEIELGSVVQSVGGSEHQIYSSSYKAAARADNRVEKEIDVLNVGDGYFKTVNIRVLSGREFQRDQASDKNESIVVNEEFVRVFDLGDRPIGKRIMFNDSLQVYVIGVVKDVYLRALFQPLSPVAFRYVPADEYKYLVASSEPNDLVKLNAVIADAWKKLFPTQLYPGRLMEHQMSMSLEHFDSVVILYTFMGLVAIIMSVSGLYSLVSLNLQKRTKELGIRKILGASLPHMVFQVSKMFVIIMVFSFIIGSVLGTVMVNGLMNSVWEYYESVNVTVISLALAILLAIAITTISYKIRRSVTANPVDSLRYE
jgi:putative ABC transport system permease protein